MIFQYFLRGKIYFAAHFVAATLQSAETKTKEGDPKFSVDPAAAGRGSQASNSNQRLTGGEGGGREIRRQMPIFYGARNSERKVLLYGMLLWHEAMACCYGMRHEVMDVREEAA